MQSINSKKQKKHSFTKGFSLLEMVIIVAIIAIMTSVMMVITFKDRDTKKVQAAGRELTAALREAQNNALTGKQQGPGLPCAFRLWTNFENKDNPGTMYRVEGSYRDIDGLCGGDMADTAYTSSQSGRLFVEQDLSLQGIEIYAYTSLEKNDANNGHENPSVYFVVPYGTYLDKENNPAFNDSQADITNISDGTEFIVKKNDDLYHICMHSTGMVEELGSVSKPNNVNDGEIFMACVF